MVNILEWLEESARRLPEKQAFADDCDSVTYGQLLADARRIGTYIAAKTLPCTPVAVLSNKSPALVRALMGIVYARCYYCVLDDRQPPARLTSIAHTLENVLVLADADHEQQARETFEPIGIAVALIDEALECEEDPYLLGSLRAQALDVDPLYVNFTSGSTGTPKGVVVGHRSVIDFIEQFARLFEIGEDDRIANQAPFDFDVSVKDIYTGLSQGATVHLIPREFFSIPTKLMDFLAEREVTVCTWAVSAMCFVSIMGGFDYREVPSIRRVQFSGEVMPPKQLAVWRKHLPHAQFANVYGPTEITCNCTYFIIDRDYAKNEVIPMGKPFPNEKVFLLDQDDALVEKCGQPGEICVSGSALALGYCNDPEKTAAAFVQNPLNKAYREPIYRTGDLAQYAEDGNLVYVGRKDHQIKHMGQRIELGEIEAIAQGVDGVERACCVYNSRKKRIIMFYEGSIAKEDLVQKLHVKLPQYMVPNKTEQMEHLPLTKNGKIDRTKLADLA